jgi:hypothetical protein
VKDMDAVAGVLSERLDHLSKGQPLTTTVAMLMGALTALEVLADHRRANPAELARWLEGHIEMLRIVRKAS